MQPRSLAIAFLLSAPVLAACRTEALEQPFTVEHAFPALSIAAGSESTRNCQSWTLGNEEPLYLNAVSMSAGPAWHHSNWYFVPDSMYDGPDGSWRCSDREFDEVLAAASGGVLFAQSTQALEDEQRFPEGAVIVLPPHARIIGDVHLVNASGDDLETAITLTLHAVPERMAEIELKPMSLLYRPLALPPHADSVFQTSCDVVGSAGQALDFRIYYVLPHYHGYGTGLWLRASGGDLAGEQTLFDAEEAIGEPMGGPIDPPIDARTATGLTFGCSFTNTTDSVIPWGNANGEMCMFLAFTDSRYRWAGGVFNDNAVVGTDGNGAIVNEGPCVIGRL